MKGYNLGEMLNLTDYVLATDYNVKNGKCYLGFNTKEEYLKKINEEPKNNYEIITNDIIKPYFDFDKFNVNTIEFNNILDTFIICFNEYFDTKINNNDLLIYIKYDGTKQITNKQIISSHIIVYKYKITKSDLEEFTKSIYDKFYNEVKINVDTGIYNKNRCFCLPHNKKMKNEDAIDTNEFIPYDDFIYCMSKRLETFYNNDYNYVEKYLINIVNKNPLIKKQIKYFKIIKKLDDKITLKQDDKINENGPPIIEEKQDDKIKLVEVKEKQEYITLTQSNIINKLIDTLPNSFYTEKYGWKILTQQLYFKKDLITETEYNKWLKLSALKSNGKYTYEDNLNFTGNEDYKAHSFNNTFKTLYNKYNTPYYKFLVNNVFNDTELNKISIITGLTITELRQIIDERYKLLNPKCFTFGDFTYTINNKLLFNKDKVYNLNDDFYKKMINNNFKNSIDLNLLSNYTNEFLDNEDKKFLCILARWGVGKTSTCLINAIKHSIEYNKKVLIITENNNLNKSFYNDLKIYGAETHLNKSVILKNSKIAIVSTESIKKIEFADYDYIILDEFESIINHLSSDTTHKTILTDCFNSYRILINKIKEAEKVICLDADLNEKRLNVIFNSIDYNEEVDIVNVNLNRYENYSHNIIINKKYFENNIHKDIDDKKNIVIASTSKSYINKLLMTCITEQNNILLIDSEGVIFYKNAIKQKIKKSDVIDDLKTFIKDNNINIFLYSPSIKTGISIYYEDYIHFDKTYMYCCGGSLCSREILQMLYRVRQLKEQEINLYIKTGWSSDLNDIDLTENNTIYNEIKNNIYFNNLIFDFDEIKQQKKIKFDINYTHIRALNLIEQRKTEQYEAHEIISRLKYLHNSKINYIVEKIKENETETNEDNESLISNESNYRDNEIDEMKELNILNYNDYLTASKKYKINNNIDINENDILRTEYLQYKKTKIFLNLNQFIGEEYKTDDILDVVNSQIKLKNYETTEIKLDQVFNYANNEEFIKSNYRNNYNYNLELLINKKYDKYINYNKKLDDTNKIILIDKILDMLNITKLRNRQFIIIKDLKKLLTENEEFIRNDFNNTLKKLNLLDNKQFKFNFDNFNANANTEIYLTYFKKIFNNLLNVINFSFYIDPKAKNKRDTNKIYLKNEGLTNLNTILNDNLNNYENTNITQHYKENKIVINDEVYLYKSNIILYNNIDDVIRFKKAYKHNTTKKALSHKIEFNKWKFENNKWFNSGKSYNIKNYKFKPLIINKYETYDFNDCLYNINNGVEDDEIVNYKGEKINRPLIHYRPKIKNHKFKEEQIKNKQKINKCLITI